jgi:hypothetical protein
MKHFVLAVALIFTFLVDKAHSSSCFVISDSFPQAYENARAVFIGKVLKIDKPLTSDANAPLARKLYRITFKVAYSWKGAGFREVGLPELVVLSSQVTDHCFSWGSFSEGQEYLVFANETDDKSLIVAVGNRTSLLFSASADLKELRRLDAFFHFRATHRSH